MVVLFKPKSNAAIINYNRVGVDVRLVYCGGEQHPPLIYIKIIHMINKG